MIRLASGTVLLSAVALLAAGCSDSGSGPTPDPQINFNLATSATAAAVASAPETFTDGANTLVLDAFERALARAPRPDHRLRVEHAVFRVGNAKIGAAPSRDVHHGWRKVR